MKNLCKNKKVAFQHLSIETRPFVVFLDPHAAFRSNGSDLLHHLCRIDQRIVLLFFYQTAL